MSEKFIVEIITPEKTILKIETSEVIIPSYEGEMGILKNHSPIITFLRPGFLTVKNNEDKIFFIEEGTVEFVNNHLLILTTKIIDVAELKNTTIDKSIESAEEQLKRDEISDKEKYLLFYKIDSLKSLKK
tara:strand:- start:9073 stop:9462 length:390 start_codon:yes stop_codon:yes gene_type:complete